MRPTSAPSNVIPFVIGERRYALTAPAGYAASIECNVCHQHKPKAGSTLAKQYANGYRIWTCKTCK